MRTFAVTCPNCDTELDVDIEEADLADEDLGHTVECEACNMVTEFAYDADLDELVPVDDDADDGPEETDAAEEDGDDVG